MHPYVLIPMTAAVTAAAFGAALLARDPHHPRNRYAALLLFSTSYWAMCEVLWNSAEREETAFWLLRLSSFGWIWIGPLWLRLFSDRAGGPPRIVQRILPWLVAGGAIVFVLEWTTYSMHARVVRTDWGWAYEVGPVFTLWYLYCISLIMLGVFVEVRDWGGAASPAERRQRPFLLVAVAIPLVVASLTDGILPILSIQVPRLGTGSLALMGGLIVWSQLRYGYSVLAPGNFAREILDALPDGVVLLSLDGRIRSVNSGMSNLLRSASATILGRRIQDLLPEVPIDPPREVCELEATLRSDLDPIPIALSTLAIRDKQGLALGLVVVVRDLREVTTLRSRLITSGRLAAVGQLAAGIAHEINNPLAFVRANLSLLQEHWQQIAGAWRNGKDADDYSDLLDEGEEILGESLEGVDRTAGIVRDVKSFSHAGGKGQESLHVNRLLDDAVRIVSPQLRGRVEVERRYSEVPVALGSSQEIRQVFVNLIANAGQAFEDRGRILISTQEEGGAVVVVVEDDGAGIPEDVFERIFDPFFTTKPVGEGTGLGLAISYEIVRRHGGSIEVESEPGRGTRVCVRLPFEPDASA